MPSLAEFYFGPADDDGAAPGGLKEMVSDRLDDIDAAAINAIPIGVDPNGVLDRGQARSRQQPYLLRGDDTACIPTTLAAGRAHVEQALELLAEPKGGRRSATTPPPGCPSTPRAAASGPTCSSATIDDDARRQAEDGSLFKTMTPTRSPSTRRSSCSRCRGSSASTARRRARSPPRTASSGPTSEGADGKKDSRSLTDRGAAAHRHARRGPGACSPSPKRRGQAAPSRRSRELGADPVSGKPMVVKDGRFGPYVTDGETNASLRMGDDVAPSPTSGARSCCRPAETPSPTARSGQEPGQEGGEEGRQEGHQEAGGAEEAGTAPDGQEGRHAAAAKKAVPPARGGPPPDRDRRGRREVSRSRAAPALW